MFAWKKTGCFWFRLNSIIGSSSRIHRTSSPGILAFLLRHARLLQSCPELEGFVSEGLVVLVGGLRFKSINRINSAALRSVNARNTAHLISVISAFSTVSWMRAAWLCDSAAVSSLPKGVTNVVFSSILCALCCCC